MLIKIIKVFIYSVVCLLCLVLLVFFGVAFMISQPTFTSGSPSDIEVSEQRLRSHVVMLSETFHPRNFMHSANTERVVDYIHTHFEVSGARVTLQEFDLVYPLTPAGEGVQFTFQNVIALFGEGKGDRIVIGAHYDSFQDTPGADDNASGIAGLLELARLFSRYPPDREIELVAYATEEPPFFRTKQMGSYIHAKRLAEAGIQPSGVLVLEMIGYFSDERGSQRFPAPGMGLIYPTRGNFIAVVGNLSQIRFTRRIKSRMKGVTPLSVRSLSGPASIPGLDFSDHKNYWKFDMPAVMITDTAFYRNPNYHLPGDTADTLDYRRMADVVRTVFAVAASD